MMMNRRAFSAALVTGAAASLISTRDMAANSTPAKASNVVLVHGLLPTAQQEDVTTLYEHWQIPMYNLDFALIPVSMDELKAAQERELWSTV
jgi:hypothetical protein